MKFLSSIALCLFLLTPTTFAASPATESTQASPNQDAAINLLRSMNTEKNWNSTMNTIMTQIVQGHEEVKAPLMAFLNKWMSYKIMEPKLAGIYAKHYTAQEMSDLVAFYHSPTGKKSLDLMPVVTGESMQLTQELMQGHQQEMRDLIKNAMAAKKGEKTQ